MAGVKGEAMFEKWMKRESDLVQAPPCVCTVLRFRVRVLGVVVQSTFRVEALTCVLTVKWVVVSREIGCPETKIKEAKKKGKVKDLK